jgi:cytochrome b pre-mRNA-processing protein 3
MWWRWRRREPFREAGAALYRAAVAAAREPHPYAALRVPDTFDGRFDMVALHVALLIRRLRALPPPGADMAQAVFDAMFRDMDAILREQGVGDPSMAKRMRIMWNAFHGRATAYDAALNTHDRGALEAALVRNVWRGRAPGGAAAALARLALAQEQALHRCDLADFTAGRAGFLRAEEALAA